jgi:ribosomal protein S17E
MGRIKSKLVKRTSHTLLKGENRFNSNFKENKDILKGLETSKKFKNQIAGYITRIKKAELQTKKRL